MNDKRFVGIKNKGPIPEGTYTFQPGRIEHIDPHWLSWFGLGIGGRNPQGKWISADWEPAGSDSTRRAGCSRARAGTPRTGATSSSTAG